MAGLVIADESTDQDHRDEFREGELGVQAKVRGPEGEEMGLGGVGPVDVRLG